MMFLLADASKYLQEGRREGNTTGIEFLAAVTVPLHTCLSSPSVAHSSTYSRLTRLLMALGMGASWNWLLLICRYVSLVSLYTPAGMVPLNPEDSRLRALEYQAPCSNLNHSSLASDAHHAARIMEYISGTYDSAFSWPRNVGAWPPSCMS